MQTEQQSLRAAAGQRFWQIDALRGLALLNMLVYHAMYDWVYIFGHASGWYDIWSTHCHVWQQYICWSFILLSGYSFTLSRRPLKNGLLTAACAVVLTVATAVAMPEEVIWFGVLHLLGCAALGDIGRLFPDADARFDNISSAVLLDDVLERFRDAGLTLCHVDLTIVAQTPNWLPIVKRSARTWPACWAWVRTRSTSRPPRKKSWALPVPVKVSRPMPWLRRSSFPSLAQHQGNGMTPELHRPWFSHYEPSVPRTVNVFDQPLYSLLDEAAARYPKRPALIFQNTRLSYKALHEAAERFAGALRRAGIQPGQRVAVMLPNLPQTMIAFWGVVKCGAVAVMVNPLYMERELLQNLNDAGAECLVLLDMLWPRVAPLRDRLPIKTYVVTGIADALSFPLNLIYRFTKGRQKAVPIPYDDTVIAWKDFSKGAQPLSEPIADPQNTPALLQYTGGTTGIPKGVALTHSNLGTNCRQILSIIQETAETEHRFVGLLPFFHVYGLTTGLTIPAALAATVLPLPRYVPPGRAAPYRQAPSHGLPRCARGLQLAAAAEDPGPVRPDLYQALHLGLRSPAPRYLPPLPGADRRHHP